MKMERFFMDNRTYDDGLGGAGSAARRGGVRQFFARLRTHRDNLHAYRDRHSGKGNDRLVYRIDQTNAKSLVGPAGWAPGVGCWAVRQDGSC